MDGNLSWLSDFSLNPSLNIPPDFFGQTTFTVRAMTANNVCTDETQITVFVNEQFEIENLDSIPILCSLTSDIELSAGSNLQPTWTYSWTLNGTEVGDNSTLMVNTAGDYILEVSDGICTDTDTAFVFGVEGVMDADINIIEMICGPNDVAEVEVIDIIGGVGPYTFSLDGGPAISDNPIPDVRQGQHSITVIDINQCDYTLSFEVESFLESTVELGSNVSVFRDSTITVDLETNLMMDQIITNQWSFNGVSICNDCNAVDILGEEDGILSVILENIEGCTFVDSVMITVVEPPIQIFAPNVFSPNGDNINDRFMLFGEDETANIELLQIFNRWGNLVFSAENLTLNDVDAGWNGRFSGKILDPGVFVFQARILLSNAELREMKGDFMLIR